MRIVVNHLTRMQPGYMCVAGIDLDSGQHVRPVVEGRRLGAHLLRRNRGPFDMAAIVDLGPTRFVGHPPEVEDYDFDPRRASGVEDVDPDQFWELVDLVSQTDLCEIFGDALRLQGRTCAVELGAGATSLGTLRPARLSLYLDERGAIRVSLADKLGIVRLPVTDLRLYEDDFRTPRREAVDHIDGRMREGNEVILSVGLTRPWGPDGSTPRHWLQVNNIILSSDPTARGIASW